MVAGPGCASPSTCIIATAVVVGRADQDSEPRWQISLLWEGFLINSAFRREVSENHTTLASEICYRRIYDKNNYNMTWLSADFFVGKIFAGTIGIYHNNTNIIGADFSAIYISIHWYNYTILHDYSGKHFWYRFVAFTNEIKYKNCIHLPADLFVSYRHH